MVTAVTLKSVYAANYASLSALGYSTFPVGAGTKYPAIKGWQRMCDEAASDAEHKAWSRKRDAGIGMACGLRVGEYQVIAIDIDVEGDALDKLASALPSSPMEKVGRKGLTRFFRADLSIPKEAYNDSNGLRLADRLAHGRMAAMPPTIHPETGRPYVYTAGPVPAAELPILTAEDIERFEDALEGLGWSPDDGVTNTATASTGDTADGGHDASCDYLRALNERALADLGAWVPTLGLCNLRPKRGGFNAVAHWRGSSTGRELEKRARNLSIIAGGIVDFGDGDRGYSPLDLVIEATGRTFAEAVEYLDERIGLAAGLNNFFVRLDANVPMILQRTQAKQASKEAKKAAERGERHVTEAPDGTLHDLLTGEVIIPPQAVNDDSDEELPDDLTRPPGLLGDVTDWIVDTARSPNRVLALGAAITVLGTLAGRRDGGPTNSGTSLYVLCLGPSGCGKQHGLDQIQRLMHAAGAGDLIGSGEAMSATAVWRQLQQKPLSVSPVDEFGDILKKINGKRAASHEAGISAVLRKAWGSPFSPVATPSWAGKDSEQIHCLAMSIYGVSTPQNFYGALSGGDLENGLLNRFLILPTTRRGEKVRPARSAFDVPGDLANDLATLYQRDRTFPALRLQVESASPVLPVEVPWADDGAEALYEAFEKDINSLRDANPESADCYARTAEMALRLATIVAVGRDLQQPFVSAEDFIWGRDLTMWSSRKLARDAIERVSDTETGARWAKIVGWLRRSGGQCTHTELAAYMKLSRKDMDAVIDGMEDAGLLTPLTVNRSDGKKGRPARLYRLAQNNRTAS